MPFSLKMTSKIDKAEKFFILWYSAWITKQKLIKAKNWKIKVMLFMGGLSKMMLLMDDPYISNDFFSDDYSDL